MVGITFVLAKTKKRKDMLDTYVTFEERLHVRLRNKERNNTNLSLLINLDPYGDKLFKEFQIKDLHTICEVILDKYQDENNDLEEKIREFATNLKMMCIEAIDQRYVIWALGD
ncbi:hypothetical protein [Bacillus sp. EAC]|uniref:hypothetical protein n=1 Tax=Bacillus sp. EAC TaxID=1978338 RepID=UPI000B433A82|nr:hypothetical protein [Bacillus sp. EAC]